MNDADRPEATDVSSDDGGRVLPFPPGGHDGRWTFSTDISWVSGAEGEWLRRELAGALRDLLVWAREDMVGDAVQDDEDEARAA